jgi:isopenicillin-N epimerase
MPVVARATATVIVCVFTAADGTPTICREKLHRVNPLRAHWLLDPSVKYLNHGSFGATPREVLTFQNELRARMERNPMQFFVMDWERLHDEAREALGNFVGADSEDLAIVPNATTGANTAIRAFALTPEDEILMTDHEYNACANVLRDAAQRSGARLVVAKVPFPLTDPAQVVEAIVAKVSARTRVAFVDHVTSQTALVFPIERIVQVLRERGVEVIVDGAHAPGMVPLDLRALGAALYTGNLHKWVCAPKGAAFLYVRRDWHSRVRPLVVSHGANSSRGDRTRFRLEWDWTGTNDPTAFLCVPKALRWMETLLPGGWEALQAHNRALALRARVRLCLALGVPCPAPDAMIASMASVPLPTTCSLPRADGVDGSIDPLQRWLREAHRIEVPVIPWPEAHSRVLRVSAQVYNDWEDYETLARLLDGKSKRREQSSKVTRVRW